MVVTLAESRNEIRGVISSTARTVSKTRDSQLLSWSTPWEASSLVPFLFRARGAPRLYWASAQEEVSFAGYGVAARLTAAGPKRFSKIHSASAALFKNLVMIGKERPPEVVPRLFGGFGFTPDPDPLSLWSGFGAACFILPRYLLSRRHGSLWLTVNHQLRSADDVDEIVWLFTDHVGELKSELSRGAETEPAGLSSSTRPADIRVEEASSQSQWESGVANTIERIQRGEVRKVVLARSLRLHSSEPLDPARALIRIGRDYPDCYRFLFEPVSGRAFFGATPELLVSVRGTEGLSVALAGSARRGITPAEDREIADRLQNNPKEQHEHRIVVETILEGLKPFAQTLPPPPAPSIRKLLNIQHLETPIRVLLKKSVGVLPLVEALHPTPAVGGAPREQALAVISETETVSRGWYAAPMGWIDNQGDGLFTVAIRSAISAGTETMLYAGAGIVRDSDPEAEWVETGLKFNPVLTAIEAAFDVGSN